MTNKSQLAGYDKEEILCSDSKKQKKLVVITTIVNNFGELIYKTSFWVIKEHNLLLSTLDINEAVELYCSID